MIEHERIRTGAVPPELYSTGDCSANRTHAYIAPVTTQDATCVSAAAPSLARLIYDLDHRLEIEIAAAKARTEVPSLPRGARIYEHGAPLVAAMAVTAAHQPWPR